MRQNIKNLTINEFIEEARILFKTEPSELELYQKLEDLRLASGIKRCYWEQKIIKPIRRETRNDRLKLDLLAVLNSKDKIEQLVDLAAIAPKYSITKKSVDNARRKLKSCKQRELDG